MSTLLSGFGICISLIAAIGAQNAFVLKQGLMQKHVLPIVILYVLSDVILLSAGIYGFGNILLQVPLLMKFIKWFGIVFLVGYALKMLYNAYTLKDGLHAAREKQTSIKKTIALFLALTWLNPHVYLDTVILIGSISIQFSPRYLFYIGGLFASLTCALLLGYGARVMAPLFAKAISWKILEVVVAIIMLAIAWKIFNSNI